MRDTARSRDEAGEPGLGAISAVQLATSAVNGCSAQCARFSRRASAPPAPSVPHAHDGETVVGFVTLLVELSWISG